MVTVEVLKGRKGFEGYRAYGHADYADEGMDIVCAGVSALTQSTAMGLVEILGISVDCSIEDGFLSLRLPAGLKQEQRRDAQLLMETMMLGLRRMEEQYSEYVRVVERTVE